MAALLRESGGKIYAAGTGEMSTVYDSTKGWGTMRFRYMGRYVEVRRFRGIAVKGSSSVGKVQTLGHTAVLTLVFLILLDRYLFPLELLQSGTGTTSRASIIRYCRAHYLSCVRCHWHRKLRRFNDSCRAQDYRCTWIQAILCWDYTWVW